MDFDIRLPVGLLFAAIGGLLVASGLTTDPEVFASQSLGVNINLAWGTVLGAFGVAMLCAAWLWRRRGR